MKTKNTFLKVITITSETLLMIPIFLKHKAVFLYYEIM